MPTGGSVVLMRDGEGRCGILLSALSSRGLPAVVVYDEPGAMVALAELAKRDVARRVLIVVEPKQWGRVDQLADALRVYHLGVHVWQFDLREGAEPMLSKLDQMSEDAWQGGHPSVVGQIRKRNRPVDQLLVRAPGPELSAHGVVTQQELTMLLGPAPGEAG